MNRLAVLTVLALGLLTASAPAAGRPNVVFFLIDDMGCHDLGCYGSTYYRTPRIDAMAREGMRFTDAYAACPVCSPTRASVMTGKYPARLNLTDWLPGRGDRNDQKLLRPTIIQHLPLEEITLAEAMKKAGYVTGHVGKWHLGGEGFSPRDQGFDVNIAGDQTGSPLSYFAPFQRMGRFMPGLEKAPDGDYLPDRLTAEAEKFIEANRDRPFFLYFPHYSVHIPMRAKQEMVDRYVKGTVPGKQGNPIYAAMVESVDESVGRVLQKLKDLGLDQNTVVFFTSDNGGLSVQEGPNTPPTINTPLRDGKGYLYEGGIREPLIVRWPDHIKAGSVSDAVVSSVDYFPTILEMCGVKSDARPDGISMASVLLGGPTPQRDAVYWHYPHYSNQGGRPGSAVRAGNHKLIEFFEDGRLELFDVVKDKGETRNLAADQPERVKELAAMLAGWRESVGARMMKPNPNYVPNPQAANGTVTLPARRADVHGVQLRYEAVPHKNTLGYWTRTDDSASWDFQVNKPGTFAVEVLQGCGQGQGGSTVDVTVADQTLTFTVEDTGHFQNFRPRTIGRVRLEKPGRYTLTVKPKTKAKNAVMDLRTVTLKPVGG